MIVHGTDKRRSLMKSIIKFVAFAAMLSVNTAAFASSTATYTGSAGNEAEVTETDGYNTVIISRVADEADPTDADNIVYIDEAADVFSGTIDYLIKENPEYGRYRAKLGSKSSGTASMYFYIGIDKPSGDSSAVTMERVGEEPDPKGEGYWNVGYILEVPISQYNLFNSVKVSYDSGDNYIENEAGDIKTGGYNKVAEMAAPYYKNWPSNISGTGNVKLAFQINHVPAAYKDSITVYMSNSSVSDVKLNQ